MKRNATQPKTRATLRAACRKALACALSAVLVVGLAPTFSIAEAAEDEADAAANAVGDGAAEGAADGFVAPDAMSGTGSQVVSIPEDSTTIHAAVALEGDDSEAASAQSGEVGLPGSPAENAIRDTTSLSAKGGDTASSAAVDGNAVKAPAAVADESNGDGDGASANAEPTVGPNPFKQGVDAQPLLGLDNYDKHVAVDSEGNVDKTETAKRWKTKVGCEGKKMWAGTLIQDNGYWDQPGWSFAVDWPQPNPLHDAEVYAYIEKTTAAQLTARSATWLLPRAMLVLRPSTSVICLTAAMMCTLATSASNTIALARFQSPASSKRSTWMRLCRMAQMRL